MPRSKKKTEREVEKGYSAAQFVSKLRRLANCIEDGEVFRVQIAGERVMVPPDAVFNIEYECEDDMEEIEFQVKWRNRK